MTEREPDEKDEMLLRCELTFQELGKIVNTLKEAPDEQLPQLVDAIDIDFNNIRKSINKLLMKP